jgi:hypothetical protein
MMVCVQRREIMKWKIVAAFSAAVIIGGIVAQQIAAPARAAGPIVRSTYTGIGSGVNENVAVIWLLGSDGGIKICTHSATGTNADAPVCSSAVIP